MYAAVLGCTGVAAGAFGAHALKDELEQRGALGYWNTAVMYHLLHATAMVGLHAASTAAGTSKGPYRMAGHLMMAGTTMFSGSLYCLALGVGPKAVMGPATPVGGLLMICGWAVLGFW